MLYPQRDNIFRQFFDLSGFWDFKWDPKDEGLNLGWKDGLSGDIDIIAVPASWNDQFAENRDFLGPAWYQTRFSLPLNIKHDIFLRFSSVSYIADVWLNGEKLGDHEGGHLPFEFSLNSKLKQVDNLLVVRVDGNLARDRVPPASIGYPFPPTRYDFYPFCGIHRPVILYTVPKNGIKDITVKTTIDGNAGKVDVDLIRYSDTPVTVNFKLLGHGFDKSIETQSEISAINNIFNVLDAAFWSPKSPSLYELKIELSTNGDIFDSYSLLIGIRTISVEGKQILLNGKPIYLQGFGKHEDFPITGKGLVPAVIIKDYSLMKWMGANSFRTSHYPYAEQMMDLADRLGFLVIDEIPAVGLFFGEEVIDRHLKLCKHYIEELIERDKNHPSVIMWSLANEPAQNDASKSFFKELFEHTKPLDSTRLITIVNCQGVENESFEFFDVVCINRYYGWYSQPGQLDKGASALSDEMDKLFNKYKKPILLSEFGADTIPGIHSQPPEMFSEEYQVELLKTYLDVANSKDFVIGAHIWNFADFKTGQAVTRVGGINYKGVFTRDRKPKMAAHYLRSIWNLESN